VEPPAPSVHHVERPAASVPGAQAISRAALLLRLVSAAGMTGRGVRDLAEESGLTRSTTHRLLSALRAEGLVDQDERTARWLAGPELFLMGAAAAPRYDVTHLAGDIVRSLAVKTEESAFLSVRRGDETVCLVREEGSFPIRSFVLSEGVRFPLGVASAGLAILSFLPSGETDAYLGRHPEIAARWGDVHDAAALRRRITETRDRGYAVNPGLIVPGSWGLGAAVFDHAGRPAWALSLTGVEFRFSPDRLPELGRLLLAHAHQLTTRVQSVRRG
jgi:DNA-binding IclR family transcriptional regulator